MEFHGGISHGMCLCLSRSRLCDLKKKKTRKHHVQCVKAVFTVFIHRKGGEAAP